ncbi:Ig-like domain-containing protein, partial [Colwellia sp. E2M01]|uniref:Ig-like domain-containing protein n=1 Tax=Colwellia sp. E2M01 TaxID=2841561 RepID=UPI001C0A2D91
PTLSVAEDAAYSFTPTVSDNDVGDTTTFSIINKPSWAVFNTATGALTGTPTQDDLGTTTGIVITVADTASATDSLAAFNITVSNTNDTPVISGSPTLTVAEDVSYSFVPTVVDVDADDTETFSITNKPSWAEFSTTTGALTGTPSRADAGDYTGIILSVSDKDGASASLPAFTINVTNTNEAPVAEAQTYELEEDSQVTVTLRAEDSDGDELIYSIVTNPEHGSLVQSTDDTWTYTPAENYNGTDSFTYITTDPDTNSEPAIVALTITPINDAPIAEDDVIVLNYREDGRYVLNVLSNDIDVDEDVLTITNASSSIGETTIENGQLIFQVQGVIEGDIELQYAINDRHSSDDNGNSEATVTLRFSDAADELLPVVTLPADINVNATALYTKVNLGIATALNSKGKSVPVSLVDGISQFTPGNHLVYWQAQDSDGFKRIVTQRVAVKPLISIAKDKQGSEGSHYKVAVHLNGKSPSYPVTIPYTISGDADSDDHNLLAGEVVIDSGLIGYIEFDTYNDSIEEMDETLNIALDSAMNLGAKSVFTLTITENNIAPLANITVSQDSEKRTLVGKDLGAVVVSSNVFDANASDTHTYTWESMNGELVDIDNDETTFTFDPTNLMTGQYTLSLTATENGATSLNAKAFAYINVVEALPTLTDLDSDGDLIPDNIEGHSDSDGDDIADHLDNNNIRCNVQPSEIIMQNINLIEAEPAICIRRGIHTTNNASGSILMSIEEVVQDEEASNIGGLFDFIISDIPVAGQSVSIVLPQRLPIPANAVYRKLTADNIWVNFEIDNNNYYSSAPGTVGYCPAPNANVWTKGLTEGYWCVQLTIEDGGSNDADGIANNQIVDPGGVATWNNANTLPEIEDDQVTTTQNKMVIIDVLANDTDNDGDDLTIISANVDFGTVTIVDQTLEYQPDDNFFGLATISYGVSDGHGTGYGKVLVNVIENTAPVANSDSASTNDRSAITIDALANDTDVDNDVLTLIGASAEQGSVVINNNTLAYTPLAGFEGNDIITYEISDNNGGIDEGQVVITINAYETITITNKSSGGSIGLYILLIGSTMLFIRRRNTSRLGNTVESKMSKQKVAAKSVAVLALAGLSAGVSMSTNATEFKEMPLFVKAEVGKGKVQTNNLSDQVATGLVTEVDDSATNWSVGIGAHLTEDWSITLSYIDMGKGSVTITGDTLDENDYHQSVSDVAPIFAQGVTLDTRYHFFKKDAFTVSGLLGVMMWDSKVDSNFDNQNLKNKQDGVDVFFGIEGGYQINNIWSVNLGIKRYTLDINDIDIAYLGLAYQF